MSTRYANHIKPELRQDVTVDPADAQIIQDKNGYWLTFRLPGQPRHVSFHTSRQQAQTAYDNHVIQWQREN